MLSWLHHWWTLGGTPLPSIISESLWTIENLRHKSFPNQDFQKQRWWYVFIGNQMCSSPPPPSISQSVHHQLHRVQLFSNCVNNISTVQLSDPMGWCHWMIASLCQKYIVYIMYKFVWHEQTDRTKTLAKFPYFDSVDWPYLLQISYYFSFPFHYLN